MDIKVNTMNCYEECYKMLSMLCVENDGLNHFGRCDFELWNDKKEIPTELKDIEWIPDNIGDKMIMTINSSLSGWKIPKVSTQINNWNDPARKDYKIDFFPERRGKGIWKLYYEGTILEKCNPKFICAGTYEKQELWLPENILCEIEDVVDEMINNTFSSNYAKNILIQKHLNMAQEEYMKEKGAKPKEKHGSEAFRLKRFIHGRGPAKTEFCWSRNGKYQNEKDAYEAYCNHANSDPMNEFEKIVKGTIKLTRYTYLWVLKGSVLPFTSWEDAAKSDLYKIWKDIHPIPDLSKMKKEVMDKLAKTSLYKEQFIEPELPIIKSESSDSIHSAK